MKKGIYAIYDRIAQGIASQNVIMVYPHVAVAVRSFADAFRDERSPMKAHAEDYDLIQLGYLSDDELSIEPTPPELRVVMTGKALVAALDADQPVPSPMSRPINLIKES